MSDNDDDDASVVFLGTRSVSVRPAQNKYSIDCDSSVGSNEVAIVGRKRSPFLRRVMDDPKDVALKREQRNEKKRKKQKADEENQRVEEKEARKTANEEPTCAAQVSK